MAMSDSNTIELEVSAATLAQIEQLARAHGFDSLSTYLLSLVEADAAAMLEDAQLLDDIRESLREALSGNTVPLSELDRLM